MPGGESCINCGSFYVRNSLFVLKFLSKGELEKFFLESGKSVLAFKSYFPYSKWHRKYTLTIACFRKSYYI